MGGGGATCMFSHSPTFLCFLVYFCLFFFPLQSNILAINMYKKFGYSIYRTVIGYYSGEEDAYDMRKALVIFFLLKIQKIAKYYCDKVLF
jgi:hypothetical protein